MHISDAQRVWGNCQKSAIEINEQKVEVEALVPGCYTSSSTVQAVEVIDVLQTIDKNSLKQHFEDISKSGGGPIEDFAIKNDTTAVITFKDSHGLQIISPPILYSMHYLAILNTNRPSALHLTSQTL